MKKIMIMVAALVLITGCDKKLKNYDSLQASLNNKFKNHILLKQEDIQGIYSVNTELFKTTYIKVDDKNKTPDMYAIFELGDDYDACIEEVEFFIEKYKSSWANDIEATSLINKGIKKEIGNYIIYVVSKNPKEVIETIKGFIK